jgi:hypothetical protein
MARALLIKDLAKTNLRTKVAKDSGDQRNSTRKDGKRRV